MTANKLLRLLALLAAFTLVAAACGSDDDTDGADSEATETEDSSGDDDSEASDDDSEASDDDSEASDDDSEASDDDEAMEDGGPDLSGICPATLKIQTDWFPEAEHGAIYEMIGEGYTLDPENQTVTGPLVTDGHDTGIEWQVLTGGPAIGFSPVSAHVYASDDIQLGYANTEAQALQFDEAPMVSVVAPLEINPQMIMWDPETYPDVTGLADLGEQGIAINVFAGGEFAGVFVDQGIWTEDQVDPSYDGSPGAFVAAGGELAQQGFASAEPFIYENQIADWGKPVEFELLHDAGFEVYAATIGVKADLLDELDECLTELVPIIQKATVSYANNPDRTNALIIEAVEAWDSFWVYDQALADWSIAKQIELGLVGNGDNGTVGDMDADRIQGVLDSMTAAGVEIADVTAEDLFTNKYIDESIGF